MEEALVDGVDKGVIGLAGHCISFRRPPDKSLRNARLGLLGEGRSSKTRVGGGFGFPGVATTAATSGPVVGVVASHPEVRRARSSLEGRWGSSLPSGRALAPPGL